MKKSFRTIEEYILSFDKEQQKILREIYHIIKKAAPPESTETISYQMPTFKYHGNLIHFALYTRHLGIYPGSDAISEFAADLRAYKTSKGAIQIPLHKPIPTKLITDIVHYNVNKLATKNSPDWTKYNSQWLEAIEKTHNILNKTDLIKTFKWGSDVYIYQGKNLISFAGFKHHFAIWFYNGVLLSDPEKALVSASEGKTKSLRQWRFQSANEIDEDKILAYITESMRLTDEKKIHKSEKLFPCKPDGVLKDGLQADEEWKSAFQKLTPGLQKEYINYIAEAKQDKTKITRMFKIKPLIMEGKGLHDKYKR